MRRSRWELRRTAEPSRGLATAGLLVAVFAALALVTRLLCLDPDQSTVFWPANGALVVAMLLLPARLCLPALLACFGINLALNAFTNYTAFDSAVYSVLNIVGSALVALATRRFCGATTDLTRVRRLATFGCIAFLSAALEATFGETIDPSGTTGSAVMKDWLQWIMCDGLGFLLATPAILLSVKNVGSGDVCHAGWKERWLLLVGTTATTTVSFLFAHSPAFMLIYPIIILTAFRAGPPWVLASILITAMVSSAFTAHGYGPFARLASGDTLLSQELVQPFLVSIFLAAVPANSALGEKNRASRRLSQMKAAIEHTATHDGLTTLANRDLFRRRLGAMLRSGAECAVLFVDLDRFKQVNDTMGHAAGDELLRAFSARLLMIAGPNATVARFGGDEFALLVPCCASAGDAEDLCRRITEVALLPFLLTGGEAHVSASVGVAFASAWALDASELMRRADIALYTVKAEGRNGFRIFSDSLDRLACDRAEIEADLRIALQQEGQLELHYQTKVDADGIVRGVEALLRWRHPTRGFIPPARLIPVAEETGLIIPLGEWVLREALQFATRWPQLNIAINVSPVQ